MAKAIVVASVLFLNVTSAWAADVTGIWECRESGYNYTLTLKGRNADFNGIADFRGTIGSQPVTGGYASGGNVTFVRDAASQNITHTWHVYV